MLIAGFVFSFLLWSTGVYLPLWINDCHEDRWVGMSFIWIVGLATLTLVFGSHL